ncbi:hypothetical protein HAX54_010903 [Datura stramonium]|uniref:Uncharacterized protein n=1 Tax=Datura stramonium TaxID=4076 RepID=A0ABS8WW54_DATST|nr:hypothetical protein [Datura stramonium]
MRCITSIHSSKYSQLPSEKVSLPSPTLEREKGAMATLNVREPTLSICFISKSPSYPHPYGIPAPESQQHSPEECNFDSKIPFPLETTFRCFGAV